MLLAVLVASLAACTDDPVQPGHGPDLSAAARDSLAPVYGLDAPDRIPGEFMVRFRPEVADADRLARQLVAAHGGKVFATWKGMKGFWGTLPEQAIQGLRRHPDVKYIEASVLVPPANVSQDVLYGNWGLDRIDQGSLPLNGWFNYKYTGAGVRVWIVDTGVNLYESDLYGRVDTNYWFTYNNTDPFAPCFDHGTPVAIMAAGTTYGVAKNATINVARVSDNCQNGSMSTGAISSAFNFIADYSPRPAVANGSFTRQCSWWGCGTTSEDAIRYAISRGVTVVLAAGNDGNNACDYTPARVSQAITVGASDRYDSRVVAGGTSSWTSNYGSCLDLFAPGQSMNAGYRSFSGTSAAAPLVAGVAATYLQRYPWTSPAGVANEIVTASSKYKLSNIGSGSPNRLLHSKFPMRVNMSYSGSVFLGGTATFYADVVHGEEPMSYQWSMYRHDTDEWIGLGTDQSQEVYFDGSEPYHVDISVSVSSPAGSAYTTSTMYASY
jgi:subtilisin family serine protease